LGDAQPLAAPLDTPMDGRRAVVGGLMRSSTAQHGDQQVPARLYDGVLESTSVVNEQRVNDRLSHSIISRPRSSAYRRQFICARVVASKLRSLLWIEQE